MKISRILWSLMIITLLASCAGSHGGFNYGAHNRQNKKSAHHAAKRASKANHDLTKYKCRR
ncbi:MAG: hypothetical protein ACK5XV_01005 [Flavobacteriales bacterium]|jgi:hypothetical protein